MFPFANNKLNQVLIEYLTNKSEYYRKKLLAEYSFQDICNEAIVKNEMAILKQLIIKEFQQHKDFLDE